MQELGDPSSRANCPWLADGRRGREGGSGASASGGGRRKGGAEREEGDEI
jgi:hypothetical protein